MTKHSLLIQEARLAPFLQQRIVIIPKDGSLPTEFRILTGFDQDCIHTIPLERSSDSADKTPWNQIATVLTADFSRHII